MGAVWYAARAELRRSWRTTVVLAVLVTVAGGLVLAAIAGASRSRSALDRLIALTNPAEVMVHGSADQLTGLEGLPEVGTVARVTMFAIVPTAVSPDEVFLPMLASTDGNVPGVVNGARIVQGRLPDPAAPHEVALREKTLRLFGAEIGDRIEMVSFTAAEAQAVVESGGDAPRPTGPTLHLEVVGVTRDPADVVGRDRDMVAHYLTPAFANRYEGVIGNFGTGAFVAAAQGASLDELSEAIRTFDPDLGLETLQTDAAGFSATLDVMANGLLVFAGVLGLGGLVAVAQTLGRLSSSRSGDDVTLAALGLGPGSRTVASAAPGIVVGLAGMFGAPAVAYLLSPRFPFGVARRAEPDLGPNFDPAVLLGGAALLGLLIAGVAFASSRLTTRDPRQREPGRSGWLAAVRTALPAPAAAGLTLSSARSSAGAPIRSARGAVVASTIGVTAAVVFAASLAHLLDTPRLYGWSYDAGLDGTENDPDALADGIELATDPAVAESAPAVFAVELTVNRQPMYGYAIGHGGEGRIGPVVAVGRPPERADEVALGREALERAGVSVGEEVEIDAGAGVRSFRVVGQAVIPVSGDGDTTVGAGAAMTVAGADRLGIGHGRDACGPDDSCYVQTVVRWAAGIDPDHEAKRMLADGELSEFAQPFPPGEVERLTEVERVPWVLSGVLGAMAMAAVSHSVLVTLRRRRRDLAVLRTLGFSGRQLRTAVSVQTASLVAIAGLVGTALGIVVGRVVWGFVADAVGVRGEPLVPPTVFLLPVVVVALSLAIGAFPARAAGRVSPALALRAE